MELKIRVLVACEESQTVCKAFRNLGIDAFSCDLQDCSGGHPEWHFLGDAIEIAYGMTWDLLIAHPPCTDLAVSGARHFARKFKDGSTASAVRFFMKMVGAPIRYIAVENPVGIMSTIYRKPDQIIQPWMFGDEAQKLTCLWLKNLPLLQPTSIVDKGSFTTYIDRNNRIRRRSDFVHNAKGNRAKVRSKTFEGIAKAMAEQWSKYIETDKLIQMGTL